MRGRDEIEERRLVIERVCFHLISCFRLNNGREEIDREWRCNLSDFSPSEGRTDSVTSTQLKSNQLNIWGFLTLTPSKFSLSKRFLSIPSHKTPVSPSPVSPRRRSSMPRGRKFLGVGCWTHARCQGPLLSAGTPNRAARSSFFGLLDLGITCCVGGIAIFDITTENNNRS